MSMTHRSLFFLILACALFAGGCSRAPVRHLASDVCMVKAGQTSRQEILDLMGEPDSKRMVAADTEQWVYYEEDPSVLQAAPVLGGVFDPKGYNMVVVTLAGDLVTTCRYSAYDDDEFDWQDDYSWQEIKE